MENELREACGIFGIYDMDGLHCEREVYYGLYGLQHRGQESAGIAINHDGNIIFYKEMGLVNEVFTERMLDNLKDGKIAVGHVRYSTTGESHRENAQPLVLRYKDGHIAICHNGNLINADIIKDRLESEGGFFQTTTDSEVIAFLLAKARITSNSTEEALVKVMKEIRGSYGLVIMTKNKLIGVRDPLGIRPLCIGKLKNSYVLSSESCGLDTIGAELIRDVKPGEIVSIDRNGPKFIDSGLSTKTALCIFEFVYLARTDSVIDGQSVYLARKNMGRQLAKEHLVEADMVIGVPDSGTTAAIGYAEGSGIPYGEGLLKNRYVGRTFIQPGQKEREKAVRLKLNVLKDNIKGKRLILIDDSIVRGTTSKRIVTMLREAGAIDVHMRISSPPVKYPCYYGIDTPDKNMLVAANHTVEDIRKMVGADTLGYLSLEGLEKCLKNSRCNFCKACFDGDYPIKLQVGSE